MKQLHLQAWAARQNLVFTYCTVSTSVLTVSYLDKGEEYKKEEAQNHSSEKVASKASAKFRRQSQQ
jgi:hypothetical protein